MRFSFTYFPGKTRALAWGALSLFLLLPAAGRAAEWKQVSTTSDGIEIFRKTSTQRGLIEFRGVGVVDAPLPVVATVIADAGRRREWIKGLKGSQILGWQGRDVFVEYDHIDMPMLFSDRDFVSRVQLHIEPSGKELAFLYRFTDDPAAPRTRYIRGEVINMSFLLSSVEEDRKTRIDAEFLCDPKGWIPAWLVNYFLQDWPETTFRGLRTEVRKPDISVDPRISDLLKP
ncbi:MAG: START domain-containing protein [Nitrospiraceae bacterium]|nr:START domain-containing protein [Nitrospiraceae bacterium]